MAAAVALGACASFEVTDPDPAGPDGGGGRADADGAATGDGTSLIDELCRSSAAGERNPAGATVAPTGTYSNWYWPASAEGFDSIEWLIGIEEDPADDGYYWAHSFDFAGAGAGHVVAGVQAHGLYNADPPDGPIELTKMAVFLIYGGVLDAELGDIACPDARIHPDGVRLGDLRRPDGQGRDHPARSDCRPLLRSHRLPELALHADVGWRAARLIPAWPGNGWHGPARLRRRFPPRT